MMRHHGARSCECFEGFVETPFDGLLDWFVENVG